MLCDFLRPTDLLDFSSIDIQDLIATRGWQQLSDYDRIGAIYDFVRNEIKFGYNRNDDLQASEVLTDGYGQCNTKGTLLMALLRALGISCRLHGFTIMQKLQEGAIPTIIIKLAPQKILHSWVEVKLNGVWINLEGFILDDNYLHQIQSKFADKYDEFCGYGIATKCLKSPQVDWQGQDTFIQKEGIVDDLGVFDSPDEFYAAYGTNLRGIKRWLYQYIIRHLINANIERLRKKQFITQPKSI